MSERLYTEGELTQWLETTGITPRPDYVDDLLTQTARSRQRSAWRFPERWLPMDLTARAPTITGRQVPFRLIGLVALVVLALAVGAALFVGSQRRLPAPFGPAANGVIVYAAPTDPSWVDTPDFQRPRATSSRSIHRPALLSARRRPHRRRLPGRVAGRHPRRVRPRGRARPDALRRRHSGRRPSAADDGAAPGNRRRCLVAGRRVDRVHRASRATSPACGSRDPTAARPTRSTWVTDLSVVLPQWRPPDGDELLLVGSTAPSAGFLPEFGYRDPVRRLAGADRAGIGLYLSPVGRQLGFGRSRRSTGRTTTTVS